MKLIRVAPFLWIVDNDTGEPDMMTEDEVEAGLLYFEIEGIYKKRQPIPLITKGKRQAALKKANFVRQKRVVEQKVTK